MTIETTSFVMHGARTAMASGLIHIEEQVKGIELAVSDNPGLAFDLAKTVIESACRTILTERSIGFDPDDELPKLFKTVTMNLPFLPASASGSREVRDSLDRTLGGLRAAVQGVCELRNACGFASHGSDSPRPAMETVQAILAAETADAIVGFLYRVHRQDHISGTTRKLRYADNSEFNEYVDEMHNPVRIFDEEFQASRVLFELAPDPYRLYLADYGPESDDNDEAPAQPEQSERKQGVASAPVAALHDLAAAETLPPEQPTTSEEVND